MQHKTLKATTTTQDQGVFHALAATYSIDRDGERIAKGAFETTIKQWEQSGKKIPLHWDHSANPEDIIGWVDPQSMEETDEGLVVQGQLDLKDSVVAREVWRSMKNDAVGLSFGFLSDTQKGKDGITELTNIDLYEISIVGAPANRETRLLSLKAIAEQVEAEIEEQQPPQELEEEPAVEDGSDEEPQEAKSAPQDPLRKRTLELALEVSNGGMKVEKRTEPEPETEPEPLDEAELRRKTFEARLSIASG